MSTANRFRSLRQRGFVTLCVLGTAWLATACTTTLPEEESPPAEQPATGQPTPPVDNISEEPANVQGMPAEDYYRKFVFEQSGEHAKYLSIDGESLGGVSSGDVRFGAGLFLSADGEYTLTYDEWTDRGGSRDYFFHDVRSGRWRVRGAHVELDDFGTLTAHPTDSDRPLNLKLALNWNSDGLQGRPIPLAYGTSNLSLEDRRQDLLPRLGKEWLYSIWVRRDAGFDKEVISVGANRLTQEMSRVLGYDGDKDIRCRFAYDAVDPTISGRLIDGKVVYTLTGHQTQVRAIADGANHAKCGEQLLTLQRRLNDNGGSFQFTMFRPDKTHMIVDDNEHYERPPLPLISEPDPAPGDGAEQG